MTALLGAFTPACAASQNDRSIDARSRIPCHSEPVTDVTGVRIPEIGAATLRRPTDGGLNDRGIATPVCGLAQNDRSI